MAARDNRDTEGAGKRLGRWLLAVALLLFDLFFTVFGCCKLDDGIQARNWPVRKCEVIDLHIETWQPPWKQLHAEGRYGVCYALRDLDGGPDVGR